MEGKTNRMKQVDLQVNPKETPTGIPSAPRLQPIAAQAAPAVPRFGRIDVGLEQVDAAVQRSQEHIFSLQRPEGYWCGELEADSSLEADYIFAHVLLGTGDPHKMSRALNEILR